MMTVDGLSPPSPSGDPPRHAVLGTGAVGLAVAGNLTRAGQHVTLIMRSDTLQRYDGVIRVNSQARKSFTAPAPAVSHLESPVDVLWITVKRPQLEAALHAVGPETAPGLVVPLLNGLDHMSVLSKHFGERLVAGSIRIEARRTGLAEVHCESLFAEVELAGPAAVRHAVDALGESLRAAGIGCHVLPDSQTVLWRKLAVLAPLALATTAVGGPLDQVRGDLGVKDLMLGCAREVCAVAMAFGVTLDPAQTLRSLAALPGRTGSSLLRDAQQGDALELDAIGGAVLRAAQRAGVTAAATLELVERAAARS